MDYLWDKPNMSAVQQAIASYSAAGGAPVYTTFDPAYKRVDITLSAGDLQASCPNNTVNGMTASVISKSSGKWYWEISILSTVGFANIGITTKGNAGQFCGQATNDWGYSDSGNIYNNNGIVTTVTGYTSGDIIGVALDCTGLTIRFYKNNTLVTTQTISANSFAGGVGEAALGAGNTANYLANFGATALTYSPPAGHNAGLYT